MNSAGTGGSSSVDASSQPGGRDAATTTVDASVVDASAVDTGVPDAGNAGPDPSGTMAFVPKFESKYVGTIASPGLSIVAHTLGEGSLGPEWLVAVKNTGADHICAITVNLEFQDATGSKLASGFISLETPVHRGSSGAGDLARGCLGPGQIGMGVGKTLINKIDPSLIAAATHSFGGLILVDAVPTTDIVATGVATAPEGDRYVFAGAVQNHSSVAVKNPSVSIFGVNSVGRPLFESGKTGTGNVPANGSWAFTTVTRFEQPPTGFVAFPNASDL